MRLAELAPAVPNQPGGDHTPLYPDPAHQPQHDGDRFNRRVELVPGQPNHGHVDPQATTTDIAPVLQPGFVRQAGDFVVQTTFLDPRDPNFN